jgi:hypothetical protein
MWAPLETHFRGPFTARSVWSSCAGDEYEHLKDHGIILCTVDSVPFSGVCDQCVTGQALRLCRYDNKRKDFVRGSSNERECTVILGRLLTGVLVIGDRSNLYQILPGRRQTWFAIVTSDCNLITSKTYAADLCRDDEPAGDCLRLHQRLVGLTSLSNHSRPAFGSYLSLLTLHVRGVGGTPSTPSLLASNHISHCFQLLYCERLNLGNSALTQKAREACTALAMKRCSKKSLRCATERNAYYRAHLI